RVPSGSGSAPPPPPLPTRRSSDLAAEVRGRAGQVVRACPARGTRRAPGARSTAMHEHKGRTPPHTEETLLGAERSSALVFVHGRDRKSTRLNSSHVKIADGVCCFP